MTTVDPPGQTTPPEDPTAVTPPPTVPPGGPDGAGGAEPAAHKGHSAWLWVSIALAVVAVGLLVWGLNKQSDANSAKQDAAQAQAQVDQQKDSGSAIVAGMKSAYDDLKQQIGATNDELQQTQDDLDQAQKNADQAEKDAATAKQDAADSKSQTEKANAQVEEANAKADAATSKAAIATDCAKAYFSAFGKLLDGGGLDTVKQDIQGVTADCKGAFGAT
jgi:hypothetical protein